MQAVLKVETLPAGAVEAAAQFYREYLAQIDALIAPGVQAIAIVLPHAGPDHDGWRRALARDLGRKYAPLRVNIVGAGHRNATQELLRYLEGASGVIGQYCPAHG